MRRYLKLLRETVSDLVDLALPDELRHDGVEPLYRWQDMSGGAKRLVQVRFPPFGAALGQCSRCGRIDTLARLRAERGRPCRRAPRRRP